MKKLFIVLAIIFLALAIGSGVFFYSQYSSTKNEATTIGTFHKPTSGPTPLEKLREQLQQMPSEKERSEKAAAYLMLMVVSIIVFIILAFVSILIAFFAGKGEKPDTVSREPEASPPA